jgi:hypothetical protein
LGQAETAVETLRGTGATLFDAAMYYRLHGPKAGTSKTMEELVQAFLAERETFVSTAQFENLRLTGEWFRDHIGGTTPISSITTEQVQAWLKGRNVANKTYNTYRNDLSTIFAWACAVPREWLKTNPVQAVPRYGQKQLSKGRPEVMKIETCQALMATLEKEYPEWCCFFAVAMFSGIRPDINLGEMSKLAKCVGRDGIGTYLNGDHWHLTPEITKDRRHRDTRIKPNLKEWLAKYPPTRENLCPGKPTVYAEIRERFTIPYDGLRIRSNLQGIGVCVPGQCPRAFFCKATRIGDHDVVRPRGIRRRRRHPDRNGQCSFDSQCHQEDQSAQIHGVGGGSGAIKTPELQ